MADWMEHRRWRYDVTNVPSWASRTLAWSDDARSRSSTNEGNGTTGWWAVNLVQTDVRRGLPGPLLSSLAVGGSLLTATAAIGPRGTADHSEGRSASEEAAKRLDAPFPAAHAASHMC